MRKESYLVGTLAAALAFGCGSSEVDRIQEFLTSISVSPKTVSAKVGEKQQFSAQANFNNGSSFDVTPQVAWSSSDSNVVSINASGLATANNPGNVTITASSSGFSDTANFQVQPLSVPGNRIFVVDNSTNAIRVFERSSQGDVTPLRTITNTQMNGPTWIAHHQGELFVSNTNANSILVFGVNQVGDVAPLRRILGSNTGLAGPVGLAIHNNELYVANRNNGSVRVFAVNANENATPVRVLSGTNTQLSSMLDLKIFNNEMYISRDGNDPALSVFPVTAANDVPPSRLLGGTNTGFNRAGGVAFRDGQVLVSSYRPGSLRAFPLNPLGDVTPQATLEGAATELGVSFGLTTDAAELFVTRFNETPSIQVYPEGFTTANTAPIRRIFGTSTTLVNPMGIVVATAN